VTLIAPEYSRQKTKPLIFYLNSSFDYNYPLCYCLVGFFYVIICIVMLTTFNIQDKKKLKRLEAERELIDLFTNQML
jgi:hypothetical protein